MTTIAVIDDPCERRKSRQREATRRYKTRHPERVRQVRKSHYYEKEKIACRKRKQDPKKWLATVLPSIRFRAKKAGLECDIEVGDIDVPTTCPILGVELVFGAETGGIPHEHSPSVDRIDPTKGYTKNNCQIISTRANRLKYNATIDEVRALLAWMESVD